MNEGSDVITRLKMGWLLLNFGYGWHISPPIRRTGPSIRVNDAWVEDMFERGILEEFMKSRSCEGKLAK